MSNKELLSAVDILEKKLQTYSTTNSVVSKKTYLGTEPHQLDQSSRRRTHAEPCLGQVHPTPTHSSTTSLLATVPNHLVPALQQTSAPSLAVPCRAVLASGSEQCSDKEFVTEKESFYIDKESRINDSPTPGTSNANKIDK